MKLLFLTLLLLVALTLSACRCCPPGSVAGHDPAGVDGSVWFCADDIYDSGDPGVVGAQQAGNVFQSDGALHIVARIQTVQCLPTKGGITGYAGLHHRCGLPEEVQFHPWGSGRSREDDRPRNVAGRVADFSGLKGVPGGELDDSTLPQTMYVDYVRVRQGAKVIFEDDFGGACQIP